MMLWLVLACTAGKDDSQATEVTSYQVDFGTDPSPPVAGSEATFHLTVEDQDGNPIENLQQTHERMVHTFLISRDLVSFQHLHHEDFEAISAADLAAATFHFPVTFPASGDDLLVFDFAHENQYQQVTGWLTVDGAPAQLSAPVEDFSKAVDVGGVHAAFSWDTPPIAGFEAAWTLTLTDDEGDVTDLVQWLGADAHAALVSEDLAWASHTHAWFEGMDQMPPDHTMPHSYEGPTVPFRATFPVPGVYKIWMQFARATGPDDPITVPFMVEITD